MSELDLTVLQEEALYLHYALFYQIVWDMVCFGHACLLGKIGNYCCYGVTENKVSFKKNSFQTLPQTHLGRV